MRVPGRVKPSAAAKVICRSTAPEGNASASVSADEVIGEAGAAKLSYVRDVRRKNASNRRPGRVMDMTNLDSGGASNPVPGMRVRSVMAFPYTDYDWPGLSTEEEADEDEEGE